MNQAHKGFCSAPFTDLIAYADGELRPCDRNNYSFGNWQKNGLKRTWNSEAARAFRRKVAAGEFPNSDCESCFNTRTHRLAHRCLGSAFKVHYQTVAYHTGTNYPEIANLYNHMYEHDVGSDFSTNLQAALSIIAGLAGSDNEKVRTSAAKLRVIAESLADYLYGNEVVRRVAPFRQVQLTAKCNSRCIMCIGKFTGEIMHGPTMPDEFAQEAFAEGQDIVDFFSNGSEFLLHNKWRDIALKLKRESNTKLRFSTNGILLNRKNIRFLIDNELIDTLTVSMDGASKETLESTRVNVRYEPLLENIRYMFEYARARRYRFHAVFGFVFMRRNHHEFPQFIDMIYRLRGPSPTVESTVLLQTLENMNVPEYRSFLLQEHHDLIDRAECRRVLADAYQRAKKRKVNVNLYGRSFRQFLYEGLSLPRYFYRDSDVAYMRDNISQYEQKVKSYFASAVPGSIGSPEAMRLRQKLAGGWQKHCLSRIERDVLDHDEQLKKLFEQRVYLQLQQRLNASMLG